MVKFLPNRRKNNKGKDFSKVDTSTQRGTLRTSPSSSGRGGSFLRVVNDGSGVFFRYKVGETFPSLVLDFEDATYGKIE